MKSPFAFRKAPNHPQEREDGFTILELLVVILIIGILAAVAIPVFNNQRKKAADASVRSDILSVAQNYIGWQATGQSNKDFWAVSGSKTAMIVMDPSASSIIDANNWNISVPDYQARITDKNTVEIVVRTTNREGSFCLAAAGPRSQWNYVPGSGQHIDYDKYLYYDMEAGGVKTMKQLLAINDTGAPLACQQYVNSYQLAGGV